MANIQKITHGSLQKHERPEAEHKREGDQGGAADLLHQRAFGLNARVVWIVRWKCAEDVRRIMKVSQYTYSEGTVYLRGETD